jgi:hypothetical protein
VTACSWHHVMEVGSPLCSPQTATSKPSGRGASRGDRHVDELSDPFAVQRDERVLVKKVHPRVVDQEGRLRVIPAERLRRLGQLVRTDREELGVLD